MQSYIHTCFDALDTYGKTPGQLKNITMLFIVTLGGYPAVLVRRAFEKWISTQNAMPTPAGIIGLLEEENARLLDFVGHVRAGGNLAAFAEDYVISKLGKNWREIYV